MKLHNVQSLPPPFISSLKGQGIVSAPISLTPSAYVPASS